MLNIPKVGESYTPAYQMSSTPFVTSSALAQGEIKELRFPQVSRFVTVKNNGGTSAVLAFGFSQNGMGATTANYFVLSGSESMSAEVRSTRLFLSGVAGATTFSVLAGLTYIDSGSHVMLTGSNGFGGIG